MYISKSPHGIYYFYRKDTGGRTQEISAHSSRTSNAHRLLPSPKRRKRRKIAQKRFSQFMVQFLEYSRSNLREGTVVMYEDVRDHFLEMIGDLPLNEISPYHWDKYKALRLKHVSPVTVNINLRCLRSILNKAFRWKIISKNPFSLQPLCLVPEKYPEYFTPEEFALYYTFIKEEWFKEVILLAVLTGMRRSEITNLTWDQVDLEREMIHIVSGPTFKTKTGKKRSIPIHERLIPLLKNKMNNAPHRHVFTLDGRKVLGNYVTQKFKVILRLSGISKTGLHIHSLRHTFASWLVQGGVPLYEVQKLLGHSTINITEIYAHLQPVQLHSAVNKIHLGLIPPARRTD